MHTIKQTRKIINLQEELSLTIDQLGPPQTSKAEANCEANLSFKIDQHTQQLRTINTFKISIFVSSFALSLSSLSI